MHKKTQRNSASHALTKVQSKGIDSSETKITGDKNLQTCIWEAEKLCKSVVETAKEKNNHATGTSYSLSWYLPDFCQYNIWCFNSLHAG